MYPQAVPKPFAPSASEQFSLNLHSRRFALFCPIGSIGREFDEAHKKTVLWIYRSCRCERHSGCDFKPHAFMQLYRRGSLCRTSGSLSERAKERKAFLESSLSPNYAKRLSFKTDCALCLIDGGCYAVDLLVPKNVRKTCRFAMPLFWFPTPKINDLSQGYSVFPKWAVPIWNIKRMSLLCSLF